MTLKQLQISIMEQMPEEWRFREEDSEIIRKHKDILLAYTDEILEEFFKTLLSYPSMKSIMDKMSEDEVKSVVERFRKFWIRLIEGPHDDSFWDWMTYVGLLHVKRRITNPMVLASWFYFRAKCMEKIKDKLSMEEAIDLIKALERASTTAAALTAEAYFQIYLQCVEQATGINRDLLEKLVDIAIKDVEDKIRR